MKKQKKKIGINCIKKGVKESQREIIKIKEQ